MKKLLFRVLIVVAILVVVVIVGIGVFLDGAIKKGVETFGPQIAKVDIKLADVNLSLVAGSAKIEGLVVGNPEGYKTPHAITLDLARVTLDRRSLLAEKIVVKSILVESPEIILEGGLGGNNLSQILDNVNAAVGSTDQTAAKEPASSKSSAGKKLQVDDFLITGAKVKVSLKGTGGFSVPVQLGEIHFTNLGTGPDGITPAELARRVLKEITDRSVKAAGGLVTDLGKGALDTATGATKGATESVEKATRGITDLFKKKQ